MDPGGLRVPNEDPGIQVWVIPETVSPRDGVGL